MNEEKQRIAIAEACGWKVFTNLGVAKGKFYSHPENGITHHISELPDYLNDLNAMHEAEKTLKLHLKWPYAEEIFGVLEGHGILSSSFETLHATARQRAEAFLRTIGKWEDSE